MNCPVCGIDGPVNARFCFQCGQPIDAYTAEAPAMAQETLQVATILCAQAKGLPESGPGDTEPTAECWQGLVEAIDYFGGTVISQDGDQVMASFGVPVATPEHAPNGALAALEMQTFFGLYAGSFSESSGLNAALRIGLHTGAVWREVRHGQLCLTGDTLGTAHQLCQMARPGQMLLSETTYRLVREQVQCNPQAVVLDRQPDHVLQAYELGSRRGSSAGADTRPHPFIGRQPIVAQLLRLEAQSREGNGVAVGVTGEAGLGKTRLIHELRQHLTTDTPPVWLEARAQAWSQQRPNTLFTDLLGTLLDVTPGEDPLVIHARLAQRLHDLDRLAPLPDALPFARRVALLAHLFGVPLTDADDADRLRQATATAIRQTLVQESLRAGHLILVLDDMHWADPLSLETLGQLIRAVPKAPLLLLLGYRSMAVLSERFRQASPHFIEMLLEPLTRDETEALMVARLPHVHLSAGVRAQILEATHGNPFYIEEVLKALTEAGGIAADGEQWVTTARFCLPQTVRELAASRLDNLGPQGKQVLQVASVLGRSFVTAALRDLLAGMAVDDTLLALTQADLVVPLGRGRYIFRHNLTQEVAYATLADDDRQRWHGAAAAWIEKAHRERIGEVLELLAWHYSRAGETVRARAIDYLLKAADRAKRQGAVSAALHHWQEALRLGTEAYLPSSARARVLSQMGEIYLVTGETEQALDVYQRALKLVGASVEPVVHRQA